VAQNPTNPTQEGTPDQKPAPSERGLGAGAVGSPTAGGAPTPRLYVVLGLNNDQRTRALAKGMISENLNKLVLPVSNDAVKLFDSSRLVVSETGIVRIFDGIEVKNEYDLNKEPEVTLSEYGRITSIVRKLVDYIIENEKRAFDADCIRYLYELQDDALAEKRSEVMKNREEIRRQREIEKKREEAKEILKDLIADYKKTIAELKKKISNLEARLAELEDVVGNYAEFVKEKELEDDFIDFIASREEEAKKEEIREKYMLN